MSPLPKTRAMGWRKGERWAGNQNLSCSGLAHVAVCLELFYTLLHVGKIEYSDFLHDDVAGSVDQKCGRG